MHLSQGRVRQMSIDLSSGDIGMSQKRLDRAQVRAVPQKIGRERMSQFMGMDTFRQTRYSRPVI